MNFTGMTLKQLETLQTALATYVDVRQKAEAAKRIEKLEEERRQIVLELDEARAQLAAQSTLAARLAESLKLTAANGRHGETAPIAAQPAVNDDHSQAVDDDVFPAGDGLDDIADDDQGQVDNFAGVGDDPFSDDYSLMDTGDAAPDGQADDFVGDDPFSDDYSLTDTGDAAPDGQADDYSLTDTGDAAPDGQANGRDQTDAGDDIFADFDFGGEW